MPTQENEAEIQQSEVHAWRDGDWIITSIRGQVVNRRLTRDRSFTHVWAVFHGNRSPDYPKTMQHFSHIEHRDGSRLRSRRGRWLRNRIEAPICDASLPA